MLKQLPRLQAVKLGIQAYTGTEEDCDYPNIDSFEWAEPPAMAGLAALTALELVGNASLPPDWRQLSALQRLRVILDSSASSQDFIWGSPPLTSLTALTRLEVRGLMPGEGCRLSLHESESATIGAACLHIGCSAAHGNIVAGPCCMPLPATADAAVVATAPNLAEVVVCRYKKDWREELTAVRPDVAVKLV